jgi:hypothetical protein
MLLETVGFEIVESIVKKIMVYLKAYGCCESNLDSFKKRRNENIL